MAQTVDGVLPSLMRISVALADHLVVSIVKQPLKLDSGPGIKKTANAYLVPVVLILVELIAVGVEQTVTATLAHLQVPVVVFLVLLTRFGAPLRVSRAHFFYWGQLWEGCITIIDFVLLLDFVMLWVCCCWRVSVTCCAVPLNRIGERGTV